MHLALTDLFRAKWTNQIHEEWIRNVLKQRPDLTRAQLERTRKYMDAHSLDCLIEGHETLISKLSLPDPNDRHVLAAAIHASASTIVTYNLKDFPKRSLSQYGIEVEHPDNFVSGLFEAEPERVCHAIQRLRRGLKNPPVSVDKYLITLEQQKLLRTVHKLRPVSDSI
jgi:predicted nucleic acid-binding protein